MLVVPIGISKTPFGISGSIKGEMQVRQSRRLISLLLILALLLGACNGASENPPSSKDAQMSINPSIASAVATDIPGERSTDNKDNFYSFLADYKQNAVDEGLTVRGLEPEIPQTGEANDWGDELIPIINPLGSMGLYNGYYYRYNNGFGYTYLQGFSEINDYISGEYWEFEISTHGGDVLPFVQDYALDLGADILPNPYDDQLLLRIRDEEALHICLVTATEYATKFKLVKQRIFAMNRIYRISADMFDEDSNFAFLVDLLGEKFTTINCNLSDGSVTIRVL